MSSLDVIFKAYDVRGVVPDEFDEDAAWKIGWAFADFTAAGRMVIARDMRTSSEPLARAFIEGATTRGDDVIDLGLASTDMLYFASGRYEAPGAMFTASHNPAEFNGIKFCLAEAAPVGQDTGLGEIKATVERGEFPGALSKGVRSRGDVLEAYAEHVLSFIDPTTLRPLKVAVDTANGMGGLVVPEVLGRLPFEISPLYFDLDGTFPNHPADPIQPENLRDLQALVRSESCDIGLAFDGDADRVFLIDDRAEPVSGSTTTALVAKGLLSRSPGEKVIHNLICSRAVAEVVKENRGEPIRSRVGHSFIKQLMAETGAIFGGEHSGHYYFRDNYRADSGIIAALVVLDQICRSGMSLSELRAPLERYVSSGEINFKVSDATGAMHDVARDYDGTGAEIDWVDGLTVSFADWWFNLRPSNTEPLLRLNLEADDQDTLDHHLAELVEVLQGR
ncbi:MAG: phosphomannomutase/phosphoglucomutase [Acidimicrobiia bacterium]